MDDLLSDRMKEELDAGRPVELCVLVETHGSSPRKAGASLVVLEDGSTAGTIGGGALERLAVKEARRALESGSSRVRDYTMNGAESDTGMICGGDARVCLLHIAPGAPGIASMLDARKSGSPTALLIDMADLENPAAVIVADNEGPTTATLETTAEERRARASLADAATSAGLISVPKACDDKTCSWALSCTEAQTKGTAFALPLTAEGRVYIIGGGHVGAALVPVLAGLGFEVVVYDARPEFAVPENYPAASRVICASFAELASHVTITRRDYVMVCTPAHGSDLEVVEHALACRPRFLGCLGSAKKTSFVHGRLRDAGFSDEEIARLRMPVGIPLGDETPAEIAISIAAQMICVRRNHPEPMA